MLRAYGAPPVHGLNHGLKDLHQFRLNINDSRGDFRGFKLCFGQLQKSGRDSAMPLEDLKQYGSDSCSSTHFCNSDSVPKRCKQLEYFHSEAFFLSQKTTSVLSINLTGSIVPTMAIVFHYFSDFFDSCSYFVRNLI